ADEERGRVVLMNDDPRVDLVEVGIVIRPSALSRGSELPRRRDRRATKNAEADREQAGIFQKIPAIRQQRVFDLFRNAIGDAHATTAFPAAGDGSATVFAARLMAACTRI